MRKCFLMIVAAMMAWSVPAQIVYECNFEDPSERQQWVLNPQSPNDTTTVWQNRWYIGEAGDFSENGMHGLYISLQDEQDKAVYLANSVSSTMAYRALTLTPGEYTIDFDWRAAGGIHAVLEVFWAPQSLNIYNNNIGSYSTRLSTYKIADATFSNSSSWQPARIQLIVPQDNTQGKLIYVWRVSGKHTPEPPSACVDNIVLSHRQDSCTAPIGLRYDKDNATLSWSGSAAWYEIRDYALSTNRLKAYTGVTGNTASINIQVEGIHNLYVRAYCDSTQWSEWQMVSYFTLIPGSRCLNFWNIGTDSTAKGLCYHGIYEDIRYNRRGTLGILGQGASDPNCTHALHTDINEIDPNTTVNGGLKTVPDGEVVSVRLGQSSVAGDFARVEYKHRVEEGVSDMLELKYAIFTETGGHGSDSQDADPSFTFSIFDSKGKEIEDGCLQMNLIGDVDYTNTWHQESYNTNVYWCDWSTVTMSLQQFIGETITIRLTAARCSYDTHRAYGYFVLNCKSAAMNNHVCGNDSIDRFEAPEGFTYRWYRTDDSHTIVSTERVLPIAPDDDHEYIVECHNVFNPTCYFTYTANPNPIFPQILVDARNQGEEENVVEFANRSFARTYSRMDESTLATESIRKLVYDYGDGTAPEVVSDSLVRHTYPKAGGTFRFTAVATGKYACADTLRLDVILPNLQEDTTQVTDTTQVEELPGDTIPLYRYTGDSPDGSTVDPVDPNQVVVTLDDNMLTIRDRSGDEISYTLVNLTVNNVFAKQVLANQTPARYATAEDGMFRNLVVIELTEEGTYLLTLSNPNWEYGIYCTFNYLTDALVPQSAPDVAPTKVLRDGQLLIRQGERMFTPTGMQVGIIVPTDATD